MHIHTPSAAVELVNTICGACLLLSKIECSSIEIRLVNKSCTAGKTFFQACVSASSICMKVSVCVFVFVCVNMKIATNIRPIKTYQTLKTVVRGFLS